MLRNCLFIFTLLVNSFTLAQQRWSAPPKDTLGVRLGILSPVLFIDLKDNKRDGAGTPIKYQPNAGSRTALTLFYSNFSLTASTPNSIESKDFEDKGFSRVEDYQFRFYYKYGTWDFFYQNYQGYYIENTNQVDPVLSGSRKLLLPNLSTSHAGIQYFYILSPDDYSLGGTFDQNIRQTQSGGSLFLSGYVGQHSVNSESPIVPANLASQYGSFANFKQGRFQNTRVGVGYGYTAVLYKFYLGFIWGFSNGLQKQEFDLVSEKFNRWVSSTGINLRLGLGYNGEKWYSGFQYIMDNTGISFNEYTLGLTSGELKIFVGSRFDGVKIPAVTALGEWLYGD